MTKSLKELVNGYIGTDRKFKVKFSYAGDNKVYNFNEFKGKVKEQNFVPYIEHPVDGKVWIAYIVIDFEGDQVTIPIPKDIFDPEDTPKIESPEEFAKRVAEEAVIKMRYGSPNCEDPGIAKRIAQAAEMQRIDAMIAAKLSRVPEPLPALPVFLVGTISESGKRSYAQVKHITNIVIGKKTVGVWSLDGTVPAIFAVTPELLAQLEAIEKHSLATISGERQ